jgi:murein DD-endopeptidase MepM/ murein hydrolase activator NlpD
MSRKRSGRALWNLGIVLAVVAVVFLLLAAFRAGSEPEVSIESALPGIGKRTPIRVVVREPARGLSEVTIEVVQGERATELASRSYTPRRPWQFWGPRTAQDEFDLEVGSETLDRIDEGTATIRVVAGRAASVLRYPGPVVEELALEVRLRPPALGVQSSFTYVRQGGCEAVVYSVGPTSVRDGVEAGDWWFPGYPLPGGGERQRFALFAAPYDLEDRDRVRLVARDDVGNEARVAFLDQFTPRATKSARFTISDGFLERVVPTILAQTPQLKDRGDPVENYLAINRELRAQNDRTLVELAERSAEAFLWKRPFLQMRNAAVTSDFAVQRIYLYGGREIDRQYHLGFDLASTRAAEIQAANDGVVVLARYFGIYGNAVVIDHGYGLMTLYGHLSSLAVSEGQRVERGQAIGRSGATGLAGGDHLHFTTLLQGLPVDPREWWDGHWIHDRLVLKLGAALPFEG